jgi:hypothetical protein
LRPPAATDHVCFQLDGRCLQNNIVRTPPFTLQYAPLLYGDSYGVSIQAVAKDIFGNNLGTTTAITLNFRSTRHGCVFRPVSRRKPEWGLVPN